MVLEDGGFGAVVVGLGAVLVFVEGFGKPGAGLGFAGAGLVVAAPAPPFSFYFFEPLLLPSYY